MRSLRPDLDTKVVRWVEWLLAKDPAERPASAAQAHHALEEIALELLGGRWRRQAALPVRTGVSAGTPPIKTPRPGLDASAAADVSAPDKTDDVPAAATRDASVSAPAPLGQTQHYGRPHRDRQPTDPPEPSPARLTMKSVGLVALASLVAAAGGYLAFEPGDPRPQDSPPSATAQRFAKALDRTMQQLYETRVDERQRMRDATSAATQAAHARAVASAYRLAATTVGQLAPAAAQRVATSHLSAALDSAGRAYAALAQAATAHSRRLYDSRAETVRTQDDAVLRAAAQIPAAG
jgi:hypothetical protein